MNVAWNVIMRLSSMNSKYAWELFWFFEAVVILISIGATTVLGWLVGLFIGEPFGIELFMGFIVIYLVNEHNTLRLLDIVLDVLEDNKLY